jgi:hypothetical protein
MPKTLGGQAVNSRIMFIVAKEGLTGPYRSS